MRPSTPATLCAPIWMRWSISSTRTSPQRRCSPISRVGSAFPWTGSTSRPCTGRCSARSAGLLPHRGTKQALAELLAELTGGPVTITDGGGVYGPGEEVPREDLTVRVELSRIGPVSRDRLLAIGERELPIGARLELILPPDGGQAGGQR